MESGEIVETHLYLVRHGEAIVNVTHVMGGPKGDTGLTVLGRAQAERLRDRLGESTIRADILIASSLPRARETAEIIAPALGLPVLLDDDLHELRVGPNADGLSLEEYVRRFGWVEISENPLIPVDPGGESWARFMLRVSETLLRITHDYRGKTIVVVCHGGIIDGSFIHFFGMNGYRYPSARMYTKNTSLTHWTYAVRKDTWHWRLDGYNDIEHLNGLHVSTYSTPAAPVPTESAP